MKCNHKGKWWKADRDTGIDIWEDKQVTVCLVCGICKNVITMDTTQLTKEWIGKREGIYPW